MRIFHHIYYISRKTDMVISLSPISSLMTVTDCQCYYMFQIARSVVILLELNTTHMNAYYELGMHWYEFHCNTCGPACGYLISSHEHEVLKKELL